MLFTIFTAVYNRRDTIQRVWKSVKSQKYKDFEWIVIDDGSTDNVIELLESYRKEADFPVRIFRQENQGKHFAWNRGVKLASGELFVPADSDDSFIPETLETFASLWNGIPKEERPQYSGINVLCMDPATGKVIGSPFPKSPMVSNNLELAYVHKVSGEKWGCIRTDVLREHPFPEIKSGAGVFPESYIWFSIARKYKNLCVNIPLRFYFTNSEDQATNNAKKPKLIKSSAESRYIFKMWHINNNIDYIWLYKKLLVKDFIDIWRLGLFTKRGIRDIFRDMHGARVKLIALSLLPVSLLFYLYCRIRIYWDW